MNSPTIVVGVTPWQSDSVVHEAVKIAARLDCRLLVLSVDLSRYITGRRADGSFVAASIDPDLVDIATVEFDSRLARRIRGLAENARVECDFLASAGNPVRALTDAANERDAVMIVVGTRDSTVSGTVREFFSGSVAANLTHRQHRPVLVVPIDPISWDGTLPWESEHS